MLDEIVDELTRPIEYEDEAPSTASSKKDEEPTGLCTSHAVWIREKPDAEKVEFHMPDVIMETGKSDYLILGLDTEYQAYQEHFSQQDVREQKAKYQPLSYQFYAINSKSGAEWSGIAIPDHHGCISLADFVVFALAKGKRIGERIPRTIVIVGHYNRADLPAFDDRGKILGKLNNIRNSMVTLGAPITLRVKFSEDEGDHRDLKLYIRDSILMAPTGKKSLEQLGKLIGLPKMKLSDDPAEELLIKKSMSALRAIDWPTFRKYALIDAEITAKYFQRVTKQYQEETKSKFVPTSLSNIGVTRLIDEWETRDPPVTVGEMVGREEIKETIFNDKTGAFVTRKRRPYMEEISWFLDFATECYHGGRNEQMWFGPSWRDHWTDYDLSSAYPTAMALIGKPDWKATAPIYSLENVTADELIFACVDFKFPDSIRYPTLPVRSEHGIVFPLEGRSYCSSPEIEVARQLGCEMTLRFGIKVPQDRSDLVFFPFIKDSIAKRTAAKTDIEKAFWKEVTNSCYGKCAQGLRDKRVFNLKDQKSKKIPASKVTNPFYAAYITSYVRAIVGEIINAIPADKMVFSVTTDGFITNATAAELLAAQQGTSCRRFAHVRKDLTGDPSILSEKHNVRRLLGWRVRGQATLEKGDDTRKDSEPIILARAGIKPPVEVTETGEQNDFILETFFSRTPESQIEIDIHTSSREMLLFNADLVSKRSVKKIGMEPDFKRRPNSVVQANQGEAIGGFSYPAHVSFSTVPWQTIEQFNSVRKNHSAYMKNSPRSMKRLADYENFAEKFDSIKALGTKNSRYLKKENAPILRLQRDLCRAFQSKAVGLADCQITARKFADILNAAGMEKLGAKTSLGDVQNGAKAQFSPHTTPRTKEVLQVLEELKKFFPQLNQAEILTEESQDWTLGEATQTECQFTKRLLEEAAPQ